MTSSRENLIKQANIEAELSRLDKKDADRYGRQANIAFLVGAGILGLKYLTGWIDEVIILDYLPWILAVVTEAKSYYKIKSSITHYDNEVNLRERSWRSW